MPVLHAEVDHLSLLEAQILLQFKRVLHDLLVAPAIGLGAQGIDGGAFAAVEHAVLDACTVGRTGHFAAERVQLAHELPLAGAADGRIARHIAHAVEVDGKADGVQAEPGGGQRRLNAGVARADDGDVTGSSVKDHVRSSGLPKIAAWPQHRVHAGKQPVFIL